jgi:hypothetical protein
MEHTTSSDDESGAKRMEHPSSSSDESIEQDPRQKMITITVTDYNVNTNEIGIRRFYMLTGDISSYKDAMSPQKVLEFCAIDGFLAGFSVIAGNVRPWTNDDTVIRAVLFGTSVLHTTQFTACFNAAKRGVQQIKSSISKNATYTQKISYYIGFEKYVVYPADFCDSPPKRHAEKFASLPAGTVLYYEGFPDFDYLPYNNFYPDIPAVRYAIAKQPSQWQKIVLLAETRFLHDTSQIFAPGTYEPTSCGQLHDLFKLTKPIPAAQLVVDPPRPPISRFTKCCAAALLASWPKNSVVEFTRDVSLYWILELDRYDDCAASPITLEATLKSWLPLSLWNPREDELYGGRFSDDEYEQIRAKAKEMMQQQYVYPALDLNYSNSCIERMTEADAYTTCVVAELLPEVGKICQALMDKATLLSIN